MRQGKVSLKLSEIADIIDGPGAAKPSSFNDWLLEAYPSMMLKYYPDHLRHMNGCVEIGKLPLPERGPKVEEWLKETARTSNPVIRALAPKLARLQKADVCRQAVLRSTYVALACERYRLEYKTWPASPDVLVEKKFLSAVPADPLDGKPIRYRKTKDGVVVYSIGFDLTDNHGHFTRDGSNPYDPGMDIGFRLWNVDRRRQPPLPAVKLDEEN
jgi:hypothetical protein